MIAVQTQPGAPGAPAECPKCRNRDGIRDGFAGLKRFRSYDVATDSWGVLKCPRCHYKAQWAEFHALKRHLDTGQMLAS
jgi:predicted nucleic-acid-binding Zn-ribbon protein